MAIVRAAIDAVEPRRLVARALTDPGIAALLRRAAAVHVLAVGKAAAPMLAAWRGQTGVGPGSDPFPKTVSVGPGDAGHPVPDDRSVAAARRAIDLASHVRDHDVLLVLLSGGASALMALPAEGLTLDSKQEAIRTLLAAGADISALNAVRKHLSAIKGGRLAAACRGTTLTLAISDVVGDDLAVIGSGPTVADPSTWTAALAVLDRFGGRARYPGDVVARLERGAAGSLRETPKPGDPRLARSVARVIGSAADAAAAAAAAARTLGYEVSAIPTPVVGEARAAASEYLRMLRSRAGGPRPLCVISTGETTVRVTGGGLGGRNQEFALALAEALPEVAPCVAIASVGTDGVDGPTDAAGALVDSTTASRAALSGLDPGAFLERNDSYHFFQPLGDLLKTGPTDTNVGDIQVALIA